MRVQVKFIVFCVLVKFSQCKILRSGRSINDTDDGKSSLAFVFDVTGSMYNDLRQVREGAEMILNTALMESDIIADFVFVPYHDPTYGPATVTRNKDEFKRALNIVRVYGGGDCPEMSLHGIQLALNVSRPRSFLYVFTDATAHDHRLVGKVLDTVQRKQSQVVFILTGHCNDLQKPSYKVYQQVAAASSGQIFNLNKTSVHKMLEFVKSSIRGRNVNLASVSNPAGYNYTQEIPVDSTLGEVTVSVSGAKPQITVVDPKGEQLTGPPKLITTLDLSEIMVVKVMQPEPGNWTITVGSEEDYSVKVVGLSNVTFNHGFSIETPSTLKETSYRPLKGTYNHLMISLTPSNVSADIQYADILSLEGKTLFELPLIEVDKMNKVYMAEPFIPPDEFFYIAINGRDQNKQELRRIGATAIQAKLPDVPFLTAPQKVQAHSHSRVVLTCNVESLVPITASWTKDLSTERQDYSSLQTTSIDYLITDMSEEHVGTYTCAANNIAGSSTTVTELALIVEPHIVFRGAANSSYSLDVGKEPNIDGVYTFNTTIQIDEKAAGSYSCVAANRGGISNQSIQISIRPKPSAQILGPHTLFKHINSGLQIVCTVDNAEYIVWTSPNGSVVKELEVKGSYNDKIDLQDVKEDGVWTCTAIRGSFNGSDSVSISVLIKPEVKILGSKNITIVNGTIYEVTCDVLAKPTPRILWHRETEEFLNNTIRPLSANKYRSILVLNSQVEDVQATYFCFGENSEGIHQDSITVDVRRRMTVVHGLTDQSVELYSQVELQCEIDSYPPAHILWYHNDTILTTTTNVYLTEDNSTVYLKRVDFDHLGGYKCEADNGFEKITLEGTLDVHGLAPPILSKDSTKLVIREGKPAIITCRVLEANPDPTVAWQYKKFTSQDFSAPPPDVLVNNDRKELIIAKTSTLHSGVYMCIASNIVGEDTFEIQLEVQYPPRLSEPPDTKIRPQESKIGENVVFSCEATGLPPPVTVWTKNSMPLVYTDNLYLTDKSELEIQKASKYDSGTYACNVTSALGSIERNFTLTVYDLPKISPSSELTKEVLEGQLVELPCVVHGEPTPIVQWIHNGAPLNFDRKYYDEYGLRFVANLTDFGEFTCIAQNAYGNTSVTYMLLVWVPPHIVPPLDTVRPVLVGTNLSLQCDVIGFPLPTIQWLYNGMLLSENTTDLSLNDVGNLNITNAKVQHEGLYVCSADNIAGVAVKSTYLKIYEPPKIQVNNYTTSYLGTDMDSMLTVACQATGRPTPYILWAKDDFYLDRDSRYEIDVDGTLIIKSPTEEMSGNYTCIAKNTVGTDSMTVPVEIYSLPKQMQSEEILSSMTLVEGSNKSIECPTRTTQRSVKWYKNAQLISTGSLNLFNVSRDNASTYSCVVTNAVTSTYSKVLVIVEWPPKFVEQAETMVDSVRGDDRYLDCTVDAKPQAKTKWVFNGKPLVFEDKARLKLINIQPHNGGTYKCIVNNIYGTIVKQFTVNILEPPFISEFDVLDVQLKEGVNATLECTAKGTPAPTVKWTYNNTNWSEQGAILSSVNTSVLSEGTFRCDASNTAGITHIIYRVTVVAAPEITDIVAYIDGEAYNVEDSVDIVLGSHVRIACKASGNPIPDIHWVKQGRSISENTYDIDYVDLLIHNARTSQSGVYSCVADNEGGVYERKVRVSVLEPPKIFQTLFKNANTTDKETKLEVLSGQPFYLHCHPYGYPLPEVYWFKDDVPLVLFDDTMVSTDYGEVMLVKHAVKEQSGNYTCVARNTVGNISVSYLVDVLVPPPSPKESSKALTATFGKSLQLDCPVEGSPLPNVMWVKHPYTEITEDTPRMILSEDGFTLTINKTQVLDSGKYSCVMTNKVGTTEVAFDVTIQKPPSIAGNLGTNILEEHVVPLKRSVVLNCEADGHPTPKITWLKDTQQLSDNLSNIQQVLGNSLLAVWSADVRDGGQYICVVQNEAGTVHRRYNIAIQVPAKWSLWSQWSFCNVTCGLGYQQRTKSCQYIDENNNVIDSSSKSEKIVLDLSACKGPNLDRRKCHMPPCEVDESKPRWSAWSQWSECSATCGAGTQARTRRCKTKNCDGDNVQIRKCPDLSSCYLHSRSSDNDVFDSQEDTAEFNSYVPDVTFEVQPEVNSHYSADVEEFYSASGSQPFYDVQVTENLDHSERGPCDPGYRHNALTSTCDDIDECTIENNHCHATQVCVNTEGAYRCSCSPGFLALGAGQRCLDINECQLAMDGCEFSCVNTAGGYVCACPKHLRLHLDRHHCVTPSLYRQPYGELDAEYLSTTVEFPNKYTKFIRHT